MRDDVASIMDDMWLKDFDQRQLARRTGWARASGNLFQRVKLTLQISGLLRLRWRADDRKQHRAHDHVPGYAADRTADDEPDSTLKAEHQPVPQV
jgi:hypothetical protein